MKNKKTYVNIYLVLIYIIFVLALIFSFKKYDFNIGVISFLIFSILSIVTESLSVVYKKTAISSGFAITYASIILFGTLPSMIIIGIGMGFRIIKFQNKSYHIFNTPFYKTLFNVSNIAISVFFSSEFYKYINSLNIDNVTKTFLGLLSIIIVFSVVNTIILSILISILSSDNVVHVFKKNLAFGILGILPMAPFGYLLAFLYNKYTIMSILLIMIPVLFARYTYMLYIDSKSRYHETVKVLMNALEMRDKYTEGHSRNVAKIVRAIAEELNYSDSHMEQLELAAYLHDIGKIGIPDYILNKPERLSDEEYAEIQKHPSIGYDIVKDIRDLGNIPNLVRHHHERYDGKGYPDGKKGDELELDVYILQLADSIDAMSTDRIYRPALSQERIKEELIKNRGTQFHPKVVDLYFKVCEKNKLCNLRG